MKKETIDEVIACLPQERTLFHYFKGQYALQLLHFASHQLQSVAAIKQSPYHRLLNQSEVKTLLATQGSGKLSPELFAHHWKPASQPFLLTVDRWGDNNRWDYQVTRPGCNLVLQLNFSEQHNRAYQKLVKPEDEFIFNYAGHPVMEKGKRKMFRNTLAWARIDFDLERNEALIEEIQSDWVRRVRACLSGIRKGITPWYLDYCNCKPERFELYIENVFAPFITLWAEAMLSAVIQFIRIELGIGNIYYHTHEAGKKLKKVHGGAPPRLLYSDLPRKFCFQLTDEDPTFIKQDRTFIRKRRKVKQVEWYKLAI